MPQDRPRADVLNRRDYAEAMLRHLQNKQQLQHATRTRGRGGGGSIDTTNWGENADNAIIRALRNRKGQERGA